MRLALLTLLLALPCWAATNYVAVTGSDSTGNGTEGNPWATVDHAFDGSSTGDTVLVQPGVYNELAMLNKAGIVLRANGDVTNRGTYYLTKANIVVDGFNMTGDGGAGSFAYGCVVFNSSGVTNALIVNNHFHDTPNLYPYGPVCMLTETDTNTCQSCVISNNLFWNAAFAQVAVNGDGHIVCNNWFSNTWGGDLFNVQGNNHIFRNNFATQVGCGILGVWGCGSNNFNGTYWDNPTRRWLDWSNTIYLWTNSTGGVIVQSDSYAAKGWSNIFNLVSSNYAHVYASAHSMDDVWTMHDSAIGNAPTNGRGGFGHSDFVEALGPMVNDPPRWGLHSTNVIFEKNILVNCPEGSPFMAGSNDTNSPGALCYWIVRNNVFAWTEVAGGCSLPYTKFYNNTYYECTTNGSMPLTFSFYYNPTNITYNRGMAYGIEVRSNAFIGCGNSSSVGWYSVSAAGQWTGCSQCWTNDSYIWTDPTQMPMVNVYTNADYNYVGSLSGGAKESDAPNYPTTSPLKFSEPHGVNGGATLLANTVHWYPQVGSVLTNGLGGVRHDSDLRLWFDFDGSSITATNVLDETGYGHHGWNMRGTNWVYATNGPTWITGDVSSFWKTNGTSTNGEQVYLVSTYLAVTNVSGLTNLTNMTVAAWTKTDDIPPNSSIMAIAQSGYSVQYSGNPAACSNSWDLRRVTSSRMLFIIHLWDDDYTLLTFPQDTVSDSPSGDLTQTNWHHYAVVVNCLSNTVVGYHDGVPFQTNNVHAIPYVTVYGKADRRWLCVGADCHNGVPEWGSQYSPNDAYFAGKMDDFRIYSRSLNDAEVASLFQGGVAAYAASGGGTNPPVASAGGIGTLNMGNVLIH